MSLYDDATFIFSAEAAAGHVGRAHALKPVEKLKSTEYITDTGFDDSSEWTTGTGWSISGGKAVADGTGSGTGADLKNTTADLSGKTVKISFEISDYEQGNVRIYFHGANSTAESSAFSGNGIHTFTHVITSGHNSSTGPRSFDSFKGKIDNFSIKEVEVRSLDYEVIRDASLTATRVKADGLIEKGRENLLKYSNTFNQTGNALTGWNLTANNSGTAPTVTSGQSGYDGSTNAWLFDSENEANNFCRLEQNPTYSGVFTFSIYAKAGTADFLVFENGGIANDEVYFDLASGDIESEASGVIDAKITAITGSAGDTDRWYRCSVTLSGTSNAQRVYASTSGTTVNSGTAGNIYIQNAQFEAGLVATPYIDSKEVTGEAGVLANEPRYDYLTSTDDCPGALIEPARTNKFIHSEYLASSSIFKTNSSFTTNQGISPEGLNNAAKMNEGSASGNLPHNFYYSGVENSKTYTISFYAKKIDRDYVYVNIYSGVDSQFVFYDLSDGTVATTSLGDVTASISDAGSGWYRISYTRDTASTGSPNFRIGMSSANGTVDYQGNGSETLFYGVQWEEGPFVTSYIPTHGSTATRENDTYRTPVDTSGVYAQDDFTVFIDYKDFKTHGTDSAGLWRFIHRNVTTRSVFQYNQSIGYTGENHHQYEYASNQATEGANKIAIVYNRDSVKVYLDGAENKVDYTVNTDMLGIARSELRYGKSKMTVNRVMVFDRPLTKDEAIALTT